MGYLSLAAFSIFIAFSATKLFPMISGFLSNYVFGQESSSANQVSTNGADVTATARGSQHENEGSVKESELTPKARSIQPESAVPTFTLGSETIIPDKSQHYEKIIEDKKSLGTSQLRPTQQPPEIKPSSSLMPPPPRPTGLRNINQNASLGVPSTGPLPNRGPPVNSQQRVSQLSVNGQLSNSRGKVLLKPGHSPMDWAALTRRSKLSGVDTFQRVTPSELRKMTGRKGKPAWSSWQNKVYNITPYLPFHPGGEAELMKAAGRDGTKLFMDVHPWVNWENMLESCLVGIMVPEDYGKGQGSSLEDMD